MESKIVYTDVNDFKNRVKEFKKLSRGNCPAKAPGCYSPDAIVTGRDGQQWRKIRIFFDDSGDERYELVWVLAN